MSRRVAILGCGPAGLIAAHAATLQGCEVTVYSDKHKSPMGGAQYLHEPVPGINNDEPDGMITYAKMGSADGYALKVYGDADAPTSWEQFEVGDHMAWSLRNTYNALWDLYERRVDNRHMSAQVLAEVALHHDLVISSIPAFNLCSSATHKFHKARIMLHPSSPSAIDNLVVYSGREEDRWYRTSTIFGEQWTECPAGVQKVVQGAFWSTGYKPLDTDCDCFPEVVRVGRFGKWKKGVLVHQVFRDTLAAIATRQQHD